MGPPHLAGHSSAARKQMQARTWTMNHNTWTLKSR